MKIIKTIKDWRLFQKQLSQEQKTLGFVPTLGNLHPGHASLIEKSTQENDLTLISILLNPTQFDNPQDFEKYPKTFEQDCLIAKNAGAKALFAPEPQAFYPDNYTYQVHENTQRSLSKEGKNRPGHFKGMLTIVLKLLTLIRPTRAYFGEKDFQQLDLIQGLNEAFLLETKIIACPLIRDKNGLALSSRNSQLSQEDYTKALQFAKALKSPLSCKEITQNLTQAGIQVDYILEENNRRFGAVKINQTRLIDNLPLKQIYQNKNS